MKWFQKKSFLASVIATRRKDDIATVVGFPCSYTYILEHSIVCGLQVCSIMDITVNACGHPSILPRSYTVYPMTGLAV